MSMMLTKHIGIILAVMLSLPTMSCKSSRQAEQQTVVASSDVKDKGVAAIPYALVYRTNGDYRDNVPVTLSDDGMSIVSFPAPMDVASGKVSPVVLDKGYLLDRRGIGASTAFLNYTYEEYARLEEVPSVEELMKHIIAGSAVVELYRLPVKAMDAVMNPKRCNEYVNNGFKECTKLK